MGIFFSIYASTRVTPVYCKNENNQIERFMWLSEEICTVFELLG